MALMSFQKKKVVSNRPFLLKKCNKCTMFLMRLNCFESALFVFAMNHFFFGIHCQRKNVCLPFSKKNMKVEVVVVYSKNNFCTSCRKPRPSIHYHTLSWQPKRLLGFANDDDDDDDDETTCSTSIFRKCDMINKKRMHKEGWHSSTLLHALLCKTSSLRTGLPPACQPSFQKLPCTNAQCNKWSINSVDVVACLQSAFNRFYHWGKIPFL